MGLNPKQTKLSALI